MNELEQRLTQADIYFNRDDIVGRTITDVRRTPWRHFDEGDSLARVVVILDNGYGIYVSRVHGSSFERKPIPGIKADDLMSLELEKDEVGQLAIGQRVVEVLSSVSFSPGSIGLGLSNGGVLCYADRGPLVTGSIYTTSDYFANDVLSYWGHQKWQGS